MLPGEDAAVFVRGKKLTSDLSKATRLEASRERAKDFLINECKWSSEQFNEIDWDMVDAALEKKPDGYKMWLSKQHTGFCGTRLQVLSYYKSKRTSREASMVPQLWGGRNSSSPLSLSK